MSAPGGLDTLRAQLASSGMRLERAWPRGPGHLLLHLRPDRHGRRPGGTAPRAWVAGQWFADDAQAAYVSARTPGAAHLGGGVVLQPGGADRRLAGLAPLLREPGAELLVHRPGRRAVVRHLGPGGPVFAKVVPAARVAALERSARWSPDGVRVPQVLTVDTAAGSVTTAALPGVPPAALDPGPDGGLTRSAWQEVGRTLAALHAATPPPGARRHGTDDEVAVTRTWLAHALRHGAMRPREVVGLWSLAQGAAARLRTGARGPGTAAATLHRDLHDKQVVVDPGTGVGGGPAVAVLDLDLVAVGEAALDVANLLVHLVLRDLQADLARTAAGAFPDALPLHPPPFARAEERARAFLVGYGDVGDPDRVHDLAVVAAARVAAVYAFRAPVESVHPADPPPDVGGPELGRRLLEAVRAGLPGGLAR